MALGQHHCANGHDLVIDELREHCNQLAGLHKRRDNQVMHTTNAEPDEHHVFMMPVELARSWPCIGHVADLPSMMNGQSLNCSAAPVVMIRCFSRSSGCFGFPHFFQLRGTGAKPSTVAADLLRDDLVGLGAVRTNRDAIPSRLISASASLTSKSMVKPGCRATSKGRLGTITCCAMFALTATRPMPRTSRAREVNSPSSSSSSSSVCVILRQKTRNISPSRVSDKPCVVRRKRLIP